MSDVVSTHPALFLREHIEDIWSEAFPLIYANQRETGAFDPADFDPNFEFYRNAEALGKVVLFTMRVAGKLVGYQTFGLVPHPRYRHKNLALQDAWYIDPEYRGPDSLHFMRFADGELERDGWRPVRHSSARKDISSILLHAGYEPLEQTFIKSETA